MLVLLAAVVSGAWAAVPDKVYYRVYDYSDGKLTYTDNEIAGTGVTEVTSSTTEWENGTYVVPATTEISSRITVTGTVNLIILDDAELTAQKGITVSDGNTLNIYMGNSSNSIQSTGQLNATAVEDMDDSAYPNVYDCRGAGIGGYLVLDPFEGSVITDKIECGNVNIHGGKINVQNESKRVAGIGGAEYGTGGNITIYYSNVTAYGKELVSAIGAGKGGSGGTVAIYGGNVNAIVTDIYNTTTPGFSASLTVGKDVQVYALSGSKSPDEDLSDDTNVAPEGGGQVTTFNNSMFTRYTSSAPAPAASTYAITLAEGTEDGDNWTISPNPAEEGATVTVTYSGEKKVKSVKAVKKAADPAPASIIDLSTLTADYEAKDGETLTGTLASNVKISIADGANVTLKDATINGEDNFSYAWAGITCAGDATITLEGTNMVKGFYSDYPGIQVPMDKTLTIQGTGSLNATSNGYGAGIGGGYKIACGNITISGGTVEATGGAFAAGIGGGHSASCGNITINGGTVTATGGNYGAGIGGGRNNGACGTITITSGVTSVTVTKGTNAPYSIGAGDGGQDITVNIENGANVTQN